jgi:hypothetical protein
MRVMYTEVLGKNLSGRYRLMELFVEWIHLAQDKCLLVSNCEDGNE